MVAPAGMLKLMVQSLKMPSPPKVPQPATTASVAFPEIESGYDLETAKAEAARCYRCDAETGSNDYSVKHREDIFSMARTNPNDAAKLRAMLDHPALDPRLLVTGAHLSPEFGMTVTEIERAGFAVDERLECLFSSDSDVAMAKTIGAATMAFADALGRRRPDLLMVVADRYEMLAPASAALALQSYAQAPNMIALDWTPVMGAVVIRKQSWDRLPQELKPELLRACAEVGARFRAAVRQQDLDAVKAMQQRGLKVHQPSAAQLKAWQTEAERTRAYIRAEALPAALVDRVMQLRDQVRAGEASSNPR